MSRIKDFAFSVMEEMEEELGRPVSWEEAAEEADRRLKSEDDDPTPCCHAHAFGGLETEKRCPAYADEVEVEVEGSLVPYDPGCTYGPIENCYPPEGGYCEDIFIFIKTDDEKRLKRAERLSRFMKERSLSYRTRKRILRRIEKLRYDDIYELLTQETQDDIAERLYESMAEDAADYDEARADYEFERRRDEELGR